MSVWSPRRFWTTATVVPVEGGFTVHLDGRPVRTPLKAALILPTEALARDIAAEWQGVESKVDPAAMPLTRMANSAIDKVAPQFAEVAAMLADYGGSDLICYRAEEPVALAERQAAAWDPLLDWAETALAAPLVRVQGVMPKPQPAASLAALSAAVHRLTPFQLVAFHDLVALSGSLVIALALTQRHLTVTEAWRLGRIDEDWQIAEWGEDEEAAEIAARKQADFLRADRFFALCG
ncbi:MAG: ATPase [Tabrizicola sp.]|nr:ATPase [Tabrizicola sp.]